MVKLIVMGSGSSGNAYCLDTGKDKLLIELGLPFHKINQGIDYDIKDVRACLVSHVHL